MNCYFQGCSAIGTTKEHIPPRSFFPEGEKLQLLTVRSCPQHNNNKSKDDMYVLAQICMNASLSNRAKEVFQKKVAPQLSINNEAFRKMLSAGAVQLSNGAVKYKVDIDRFDKFFSALSFGVIYKTCKVSLPINYKVSHIFHNFIDEISHPMVKTIEDYIEKHYSGKPMNFMTFGELGTNNESTYTATIFGIPGYKSSITIVHLFYGVFKVTSMLTLTY